MILDWLKSPLLRLALVLLGVYAFAKGAVTLVQAIEARGFERADAACKIQVAGIKDVFSRTARIAELKYQADREAQNRNLLRLSEQLITANGTIEVQKKRLQEQSHAVSTQYRPQPGATLQSAPRWIVTRGWVCNYNRAIGYAGGDSMPGAGAADGGDEAASCTADPFAAVDVDAERILNHHIEYGAYCRKLEQQVNVLLDDREFLEHQAAERALQETEK